MPSPSREQPTRTVPADLQALNVEQNGDALDQLPALIPVPRAAAILGLSRASAYRYAAAGELPVHRFGGRVYVITARIRHLLEGTEGPAA